MSKQLREYVPEDKINDPPFLPRASLMKCVCVFMVAQPSWHTSCPTKPVECHRETLRWQEDFGNEVPKKSATGRGSTIQEVFQCFWRESAFSETVSEIACVFWNHLASNRRDGELDQRRAAAKISDTRGNNFMEVYSRHLQATQDSTDWTSML